MPNVSAEQVAEAGVVGAGGAGFPTHVKLAAEKKRWDNPPLNPKRAKLHLENRKAPMKRLMQKLGLTQFHNVGPLAGDLLLTPTVGIRLKQHIGVPCEPAVGAGDRVTAGQIVGRPPATNLRSVPGGKPALGTPVHASIDGHVTAVRDGIVWIEKREVRDEG